MSDVPAGAGSLWRDAVVRRITANTGWLVGAQGVGAVLALGQEVLVARTLGAADFGLLAVTMTFVAVVNRLTAFRMGEFVVKFASDSLAEKRQERTAAVFKLALAGEATMSVLAFALILVLAPLGARWFLRAPEAWTLIAGYSVVVLANACTETAQGVLQVFDRFRQLSVIAALGRLCTLVAVALAVALGGGMWSILLALVAGNAVTSGLTFLAALREVRARLGPGWWRVPLTLLRDRWSAAWRFTLHTNLGSSLSLITRDADLLWLGLLRGTREAAYFRVATTLLNAILLPVGSLVRASYPEIARQTARRAWDSVEDLLRRLSKLAGAWVAPTALLLALAAGPLIVLMYGGEYRPSAPALQLLLIGGLLSGVFFWTRSALLALGRPDVPLKINVLVAVLKLAGVFTLVAVFGYLANAALLSALYALGISLSLLTVRSELRRRRRAAA